MFADSLSSSLLWNIAMNLILKLVTQFFKNRGLGITEAVCSHLLGHTLVSECPILF